MMGIRKHTETALLISEAKLTQKEFQRHLQIQQSSFIEKKIHLLIHEVCNLLLTMRHTEKRRLRGVPTFVGN